MSKTPKLAQSTTELDPAIHQKREIIHIPLSDLSLSPKNMRKTKRVDQDFVESIRMNGVIQALAVDSNSEIIGGGRRYNALLKLLSKKIIDKDYPVPCVRVEDDQAGVFSYVENFHRSEPHPSDYYTAIVNLSKDPTLSKQNICSKLQIDSLDYDKYIRLAGLHNKIFKAYASNTLDQKQAQAFAATDNKTLQIQIWKNSDFDPGISAQQIKRAINGDLTSNSALIKFITLDAYIAANGKTSHDLFEDVHAIHDPDIAQKLADQKLTVGLDQFKIENPGWKWYAVDTLSESPETKIHTSLKGKYRNLKSEQKKILGDLSKEIDILEEKYHEEITPKEEARLDELLDIFHDTDLQFDSERLYFTKTQMKISGVMATMDDRGVMIFEQGSQTKEDIADEKAAARAKAKKATAKGTASTENTSGDEVDPQKLTQALELDLRLTHRSFLKAQLLKYPDLAVEILNYSLIVSTVDTQYSTTFNSVRTHETNDETDTNQYTESKAALILEKGYQSLPQEWLNHESNEDKFKAYVALKDQQKQQLLAYVSMITLSNDLGDTIAKETDLNPRDYWTPTETNYFGRISKTLALTHIEEILSPKHRKDKETSKKKDIAAFADSLFRGGDNTFETIKSWLPPYYRKK